MLMSALRWNTGKSSPVLYASSFAQSCPTILWPHGLQPARLLCPWDSPGKSTRVDCYFLLQKIFPTQRQNPHLLSLLHWQVGSLPLSHLGSPLLFYMVLIWILHDKHCISPFFFFLSIIIMSQFLPQIFRSCSIMVTLLKTSYPICISGLTSKTPWLPETFHHKSGPFETEGTVFSSRYLKVSSVWKHCKTHFCSKDASVRFSCPSSNRQPADHMDGQPDSERVFHNGIMLPGSRSREHD